MKLFAFLILLCLSSTLTAQDLTYDMVQKTTQKTPITFANYTTSFIDAVSYTLKVGDRITIGKPSNGLSFAYIFTGDGGLLKFEPVSYKAAGKVLTIHEISVFGKPGYGFHAHIRTGKYGIQIEDAIRVGEVVVGR